MTTTTQSTTNAALDDAFNLDPQTTDLSALAVLGCFDAVGELHQQRLRSRPSDLRLCHPGRPFNFPYVEAGVRFDNPGFLTGAAGTALALADHGGLLLSAPKASWDCLLLLS